MKFKGLKVPETFKTNGFEYNLLKYGSGIALYEQLNKAKVVYGYELHLLRIRRAGERKYKQPDGTFKVVIDPEKVRLASNEEFGTYAWSYATKARALQAFDVGK